MVSAQCWCLKAADVWGGGQAAVVWLMCVCGAVAYLQQQQQSTGCVCCPQHSAHVDWRICGVKAAWVWRRPGVVSAACSAFLRVAPTWGSRHAGGLRPMYGSPQADTSSTASAVRWPGTETVWLCSTSWWARSCAWLGQMPPKAAQCSCCSKLGCTLDDLTDLNLAGLGCVGIAHTLFVSTGCHTATRSGCDAGQPMLPTAVLWGGIHSCCPFKTFSTRLLSACMPC